MAICCVSLILPRVKHGAGSLQRTNKYASLLRIACLSAGEKRRGRLASGPF
jgi:hypothetical protein